jgi:hypothetical protein
MTLYTNIELFIATTLEPQILQGDKTVSQYSTVIYVGYEVLTVVVMKSSFFWDTKPCPLKVN